MGIPAGAFSGPRSGAGMTTKLSFSTVSSFIGLLSLPRASLMSLFSTPVPYVVQTLQSLSVPVRNGPLSVPAGNGPPDGKGQRGAFFLTLSTGLLYTEFCNVINIISFYNQEVLSGWEAR